MYFLPSQGRLPQNDDIVMLDCPNYIEVVASTQSLHLSATSTYKYHICWSSNPVSNQPMHCRVSAAMARRCSTSQLRCGSIKVNTRKWSNIEIPSDRHIKYIWVDDKRPHCSTEMMRSVYRDNYSKMDLFQVTGPFLLGGALAKRRSVAEHFRSVFIYFYLPSNIWPG